MQIPIPSSLLPTIDSVFERINVHNNYLHCADSVLCHYAIETLTTFTERNVRLGPKSYKFTECLEMKPIEN
jgi:hypothetical protein